MNKHNIKNLGRRSLALLLSLVMALGMFQVTALAEDDSEPTDTFTLSYDWGVRRGSVEGVTLPSPIQVKAGSDVKLYLTSKLQVGQKYDLSKSKKDYKFLGRTLKPDTGPALAPGRIIQMAYDDMILYALWEPPLSTGINVKTPDFTVKWVSGYRPEKVLQTGKVLALAADMVTPICPAPPQNPTRPDEDGIKYAFAGWSEPVLSKTEERTYIITAQWAMPDKLEDPIAPKKEDGGDNIPDTWQYVVNYEVKNGTLTYGGQSNLSSAETVVTRRDDAGTPCNGGTARLAEAHLATGTPIANYGNAKWYIKATGSTEELGTPTEAPVKGTVITGNVTYTVVYSKVNVTAVPNGGEWQSSLPSNWTNAATSGNKVSELANGSVTLPVAADITKTGLTLAGWKADDAAKTLYAPGASVSPDKDLTVTAQWAGLKITKTADPTSGVKVGEDIAYTITVENTGNVDLTDVVVDDTMKTKVTLADGSAWSIGDLAHGASKEIKYTYKVAAADVTAGKVENTATVEGTIPNGPKVTATSEKVEVPVQNPELTIEKTANKTSAKLGDVITFSVKVTNSGDVALTNVTVVDPMMEGGQTVIASLTAGATETITYTHTVDADDVAAKKVSNTATVNGTNPDGPAPEEKKDTEEVPVQNPELSIEKTADKTSAKLNDVITFTVKVTNTGDVDLTNVTVVDPMMEGGQTVIASLTAGATETITYDYTVTADDVAAGKVSNTATVSGTNPDGPAPEEKDDTVEVPVQNPELCVIKSATDTVKVGEDITYTITVSNSGDVGLTGVSIYDQLDSSLTLVNVTLNGESIRYSYNPDTHAIYVTVGVLNAGDPATLTITATATAVGTVTNTARANSVESEPSNSNSVTTVVTEAAAKQITVTWIDGHTNGTIKQETITEGSTIPANPAAPNHESEGYRFTGWSQPVPGSDGNITITASYEPIPQPEKINVTWVDGYNGDILKELPGVYDKGTTTIPKDQYPSVPAHAGYTFEQWTSQVLGNGDIIITANYRTLEVNPGGPSFEDLTNLGITVEVVCDTNATHGPETRRYPLMEGSYETFVANGSCTLVIYNDLYVKAYGGDHSLVGEPARVIMLEYVDGSTPATINDAGTEGAESIDADSNTDSENESTDGIIDNNVGDDTDVPTPDAGTEIGSENSNITDNSGEETGNGNSTGGDIDEIGPEDDNGDIDLSKDDININIVEPIQLMSVEAISFSAPTATGGWVIAQGYTNTVTFHVRCEQSVPQPETITVTWVDGYTNSQIAQEIIDRGSAIPTYPSAPDHASVGYEFTGWSDPAEDSDGNITITANYRPITRYTVTFISRDAVVATRTYRAGEHLTLPVDPASYYVGDYRYDFTRWTPAVEMTVNGDATYTAVFEPTYVGEGPVVPVPPVTPVTPVTPTPGPTVIPDNPTPLDPGTTITDDDVPLAGAVGLNDVDHFAYIIGYDEDHVRPLNNITRAEVATIFFRLMTDEYRNANWSTSNDFSDVQAGSWYNNAISTCTNAGALKGYADGSFKPNASITRAEFAAIAARFLSDEYTDDGTGDFSDTANHWAAKEIRLAAKAGWVRGDGNKFRPNDPITRAEVMTIVNRMLDRVPDADHMLETMKKWVDNPEDAWYYEAVQEATNEHAYERDADLGVIETWTEILEVRDWKALETSWASANA